VRSPLFDALVRCDVRRLRAVVGEAPLVSLAVTMVVLAAPLVVLRAGGGIGRELAGAVQADGVAAALVLGPVLAAAMAGAAIALTLPGRSTLGQQIAAGPVDRRVALVAGLAVPGVVGAVAVFPSLLAACLMIASALPGGPVAGCALAAAVVAALPAGALAAEGAVAVVRRQWGRSLTITGGAGAWMAFGVVLGTVPLGPLAPVVGSLRGTASPWIALVLATGAAVSLGLTWVVVGATRAEPHARKHRPAWLRPPVGRLTVPAAVAVLLARRSDVRLAAAGAVAFGWIGTAVSSAASSPPPSAFVLATTTALLGAVVCPLVTCGALGAGGWLWRSAPAARRPVVTSAVLAGVVGAALPVVLVGAVAVVVSGATWPAVGAVAGILVGASAVALVAGALVPWGAGSVGDQVASFAAFAAIVVLASIVVGSIAPRLVALGLSDTVVVIVICLTLAGAAALSIAQRLRIAAR
jgi:hypothetical protein